MSSTTWQAEADNVKKEGGPRGAEAPFLPAPLVLAQDGFVAESIVDGPGLRCTVFVQGCPHACPGCHNPATHPFNSGQQTTPEEVYRRIKASPLCRAVTFSGGEPFCQAGPLVALAKMLRADGYELAAYTGYPFEYLLVGDEDQRALLALLDTLIDGPFLLAQRDLTLRFRGSSNQRILNVPQSLRLKTPVWETGARWVGERE